MARVGPENYDRCLAEEYASEMDLTGKALRGMIYVAPALEEPLLMTLGG